mmetsp:Transcript_3044/g.9276  ORF Transcript_3044/g.9276 Transcript_3044/m.9276 type:complete len:200 (-) Transcript_3044:820-1419(-)
MPSSFDANVAPHSFSSSAIAARSFAKPAFGSCFFFCVVVGEPPSVASCCDDDEDRWARRRSARSRRKKASKTSLEREKRKRSMPPSRERAQSLDEATACAKNAASVSANRVAAASAFTASSNASFNTPGPQLFFFESSRSFDGAKRCEQRLARRLCTLSSSLTTARSFSFDSAAAARRTARSLRAFLAASAAATLSKRP